MAEVANKFSLFGFTFSRDKNENDQKNQQSFSGPNNDDGALTITSAAYYGTYVDMDGTAKNEVELISRYREMAMQPEIESALDDIINEAISINDDGRITDIVLDDLKQPEKIKKAIREEFATVLKLLNYKNMAQDIFRRYYVDGKMYYHIIIDKDNPTEGIKALRYIDPRKLRKVREIKKKKDDRTGVDVMNVVNEYYIFNDKVAGGGSSNFGPAGVRITTDSIISVVSGLMDSRRSVVLSYLHKAIKPLNQLRMIEDATVIYRICLVGETRVKTDTGYKYIKDINAGDVVYSFNANGIFKAPVKSAWSNGVKDVFTVKSLHHSITGTATHPVLVYDDTTRVVEYIDIEKIDTTKHSFVWETTQNTKTPTKIPKIHSDSIKLTNSEIWSALQIKNKEAFISNIAEKLDVKQSSVRNFLYGQQFLNKDIANKVLEICGISSESLLEEKTEGHCQHQLNLPENVDIDFAQLFGFLIGDGTVRKNTISFAEGVDDELNEKYSSLLKKFFGNCIRYPSPRKYTNYTTSSTLGADVMREMGWIVGSKNKRIPQWVFESPDAIKLGFILGLSEADGHEKLHESTGRWQSEISLCNKRLVEDVKEIWTSLGFASGQIRYRKREAQLRIVGDETEPRLMPATESWDIYISNIKLDRFEKITSIVAAGQEEVFDLEVDSEKHNFIANGVVVHNSRAPERRIFYIDVGNLPKLKAEQYLRDIMAKYKNKLVYDAATGEVRDDRKFMSMMEDFWLPRREGGKGTEITTLPGGQNLGELEDVKYFERKLYKALNVPVSRLEPNQGFALGRVSEVTRDELKFAKFIDRLRNKFSDMFNQALRAQCVLKGICTSDEWEDFKEHIYYDFIRDNNFAEMKDAELMKERLSLLSQVDPYTGAYYSKGWIQRNVLRLTDLQIEDMQKEIGKEKSEGFDVPVEVSNAVTQQQMMNQLDPPIEQPIEKPIPEEYSTFDTIKRVL